MLSLLKRQLELMGYVFYVFSSSKLTTLPSMGEGGGEGGGVTVTVGTRPYFVMKSVKVPFNVNNEKCPPFFHDCN